jgi:pyruvate,water dikinase
MIVSPTFEERHDLFWDLVRTYQAALGKEVCSMGRFSREEPAIILRQITQKLTLLKKVLYVKALRQAQQALALRERGRLLQSLLFGEFRHVALAAGKILKEKKYIDQIEDIFFLHAEELEKLINGKFQFPETIQIMVQKRKESLKRNQDFEPPAFFILKQGEYLIPDRQNISVEIDSPDLRGVAVSKGSITGISRVIIDPTRDSPLQPGEILIARTTDPGWTPLFLIAGGLVMEKGSLLSHGAIVAREFGIPAVVGVNNATKIVGSGKKILLDGDRGIIKILEDQVQ